MKSPKPRPGYVERGVLVPAYPTPEQTLKIQSLQPSLRACWNWLVWRIEEPIQAREAKAIHDGLISPRIVEPRRDNSSYEEYLSLRKEWAQACQDRHIKLLQLNLPVEWRPYLSGPGSEAERLGMKHGYQVLNNYLKFKGLPEVPSRLLQKLEANFLKKSSGQGRKIYKRQNQWMPIQVKSSERLRFRKSKKNDTWHQKRCNFDINIDGIGRIAIYLDPGLINMLLTPGNTIKQGRTLKYVHGKWFVSFVSVRREVMHAGPGDGSVCGIDPGLETLITVSDGQSLSNPRNLEFAEQRAIAMSVVDTIPASGDRDYFRTAIFRNDAKLRRKVHTECRQFVARLSKQYDFIGVEENSSIALGIGSRFEGVTKTLVRYLKQRCGSNRVWEIEAPSNSQVCSNCGHQDKLAWKRKPVSQGQTCTCRKCGFSLDRDENAAKNVRSKLINLLYA